MKDTTEIQLLTMLQHSDSQFPSGGFAFSQGLEASALLADTLGRFDFANFVEAQIRYRWAGTDRIALVRAHRLSGNINFLAELDHEVDAATLSESLRTGSRRNGVALLTAHARISTRGAAAYRSLVEKGQAYGHLAVMQGLLWQALGIDEEGAVCMAGYQVVASLSTAAVRLGLIGAIDAQKTMRAFLAIVAKIAREPVSQGQSFHSFIPLAEIATALRGSAEQRLFYN